MEKIRKLDPIVKSKELKFMEETSKLEEIREQRHGVFNKLRQTEKKYIDGVELLNEKKSSNILEATSFAQSLDYVKSNWHKTVTELKNIEQQEKSQINMVLEAQKELKSTEILQEKYRKDLEAFLKKSEQKNLDSIALRKEAAKSTIK